MLPTSHAGFAVSLALLTRILRSLGPQRTLVLGLVILAGGHLWLAYAPPAHGYVGAVLPGLLLVAIGVGPPRASWVQPASRRRSPQPRLLRSGPQPSGPPLRERGTDPLDEHWTWRENTSIGVDALTSCAVMNIVN
jgi:hypothetical protein